VRGDEKRRLLLQDLYLIFFLSISVKRVLRVALQNCSRVTIFCCLYENYDGKYLAHTSSFRRDPTDLRSRFCVWTCIENFILNQPDVLLGRVSDVLLG
jgi:hypothetical protein